MATHTRIKKQHYAFTHLTIYEAESAERVDAKRHGRIIYAAHQERTT